LVFCQYCFSGLGLVYNHPRRKVTLYASLHAKIDEHQKGSVQTAEMLKEAKRRLVSKTGVVIDEEAESGKT